MRAAPLMCVACMVTLTFVGSKTLSLRLCFWLTALFRVFSRIPFEFASRRLTRSSCPSRRAGPSQEPRGQTTNRCYAATACWLLGRRWLNSHGGDKTRASLEADALRTPPVGMGLKSRTGAWLFVLAFLHTRRCGVDNAIGH